MPAGGKHSKLEDNCFDIGTANDPGQDVFLGVLQDNIGAYLMQPNGKLSLVRQSGDVTHRRKLVLINPIAGRNNKGEVALAMLRSATQRARHRERAALFIC
jgi:hypothetical protein